MEFLSPELSKRGLSIAEMLYQSDKVKVYEARDSSNHAYVVKNMTFPTSFPFAKAVNEVQIAWTLDHPNIIKCLDHFYYQSSHTTWQLVLIFEKWPKDLMKEIKDRFAQHYYWTDEELMHIFGQLISAFAYMQDMTVCHRDIKPQNILINRLTVLVTDFGTSKQSVNPEESQTMTGTPFFLSPPLKAGLLARQEKVVHNVYKSDVYSLGITFLTMVKLEAPMSLANMEKIEESTAREIQTLTCAAYIRNLIAYMLRTDESQRPDFLDLREYMRQLAAPQYPVPIGNVDPIGKISSVGEASQVGKMTQNTQVAEVGKVDIPPLVQIQACSHILSNSQIPAVVMMPCHGYLCYQCVISTVIALGNCQMQCKLCLQLSNRDYVGVQKHTDDLGDHGKENGWELLQDENIAKNKQTQFEPLIQDYEEANKPIVCSDCRQVKRRDELVPNVGVGSLYCLDCEKTYETYHNHKFGQDNRRIRPFTPR